MTPEEIRLVQESFRQLQPHYAQAGDLFYGRLFQLAPELRAMFPVEMVEQHEKFFQVLGTIVYNMHSVKSYYTVAQQLAFRHVGYGVKPHHFPLMGACMIWTVQQMLGEDCPVAVRDAWITAYATLSQFMIDTAGSEMANG